MSVDELSKILLSRKTLIFVIIIATGFFFAYHIVFINSYMHETAKKVDNKFFPLNHRSDGLRTATSSSKDNSIENDILIFTKTSCDPIYPKVLLYNRIFKTGSTSLGLYIKDALKGSGIALYKGTTEDWYKNDDPYPYPDIIQNLTRKSSSSVFEAHFFFRRDLHISKSYTYINVLRNPVDRVISHYWYTRNSFLRPVSRVRKLKKSGLWNETIFDCLQNQHQGCEDNIMTRFFCGTKSYCKHGTNEALKLAKFNMNFFYASIGIYENLSLTLKTFEKRLPAFFVNPVNNKITLHHYKLNRLKTDFNETVRNYIASRNKADIDLYNYAKDIFNKQLKICAF